MKRRTLSLTKQTVDRVISMAGTLQRATDIHFPPADEPVRLTDDDDGKLEQFFACAEFVTFRDFLAALSAEEMRELQALMYLGRGDFKIGAFWSECDALPICKDPKVEAEQVMEKAQLIEYLSDGFEKVNRHRLL